MGPLTLITFLPAVGAAVIGLLPAKNHNLIRYTALVTTLIVLIIAGALYPQFSRTGFGINEEASFQFVEHANWIPAFNIEYFVGVDGLSFPMVLLTALLSFLCIPASFGIKKGVKGYFAMFLLLETGMMGTFVALDFFLFYVFWEIMLLPMYFLIGIWGGPRRVYAAIKFFIYTLVGSVLMLLVMLAFYFNVQDPVTGANTFNMLHMMGQDNHSTWLNVFNIRALLWFGLFIGFAIKVPVFPFHTWLPDAHVEAPTAVSVILAGILLKMGTYGMLRIMYPILPDATMSFLWFIALMGVINIIYGAFCAMAQKDLKKLVAYSSISHMGYVMLGMAAMTSAGINGAVFQMFNHGCVTAMLFLLVGVIYERAHHREIARFGNLSNIMPKYLGISAVAFFGALGLPGLSAFISEAMVFLGSFPVWPVHTILAVSGIIVTAAYVLWTLQRMFFGEVKDPALQNLSIEELKKKFPEINGRELFTLIPLAIIIIFLGIWPHPVLNLMNASLVHLIDIVKVAPGSMAGLF
ncbi:oxidoreductase [candidate division LCP-89 bacterium B3_LCP]|uniref:Oxidoreductase n=1 Tax=candidate division LCP-89 bacterium B3_LCP TaxID=2012998 RepID=A0A532V5T4_UNCL8|nr:MAG: oxidoreductase [candidate division LCP-89 bacterium B3_LCP]